MTQPTVSVIVPNYNYAAYLPQRLDSILDQTYRDFELIILDDASTDDSRDVIERYRDNPRVSHIVYNDTNTGSPFRQWQKGLALARGRYVWIAEADDWADPTFLHRCVTHLDANPRAAICYTDSVWTDSDGNEIDNQWIRDHMGTSDSESYTYESLSFIKRHLYWQCYIYNASGTVFRRDAAPIDRADLWSNMRYAGDYMFWILTAAKGDVIRIFDRLNYFRRHLNATTKKGSDGGLTSIEDMHIIRYMESHFKIGYFKRLVKHGSLIKRIKRSVPEENRQPQFDAFNRLIGHPRLSYFMFKFNQNVLAATPLATGYRRDRIFPKFKH
ncbi:MAG: glycosyltransferase [Pseudoflavonifractor sp.]|nr:glycosyltransferase [Pseudoflavonifractor sp.]